MDQNSESTQAIRSILLNMFGIDADFDESRGDANLTVRVDHKRYRVYVADEFEQYYRDYPKERAAYDSILRGLPNRLPLSATGAVLVTLDGIEEHPGPDF